MKNYIILIDGNSYLYKSFYGIPALSTKNGQYTNAIYGFLRMLIKVINKFNPKKLIVAFDAKDGAKKRQVLHENYKIHRQPMPDNLISQLIPLNNVLSAMNIPICRIDGIEADDTIAKLIHDFHNSNYKDTDILIISSDKDLLQYICDNVYMYDPTKDQIINADEVNKKWGIKPSQIPDLLALMGDKSDNIPGINGIGEKTAIELLNKYGSLENIFNNIDDLKGKIKDKIVSNKDIAILSYKLAKPNLDVDVDLNKFEDLNIRKDDNVFNLLKDLELYSIIKELRINIGLPGFDNSNFIDDNENKNDYIVLDDFTVQVGNDIITADYKKFLHKKKEYINNNLYNTEDSDDKNISNVQLSIF